MALACSLGEVSELCLIITGTAIFIFFNNNSILLTYYQNGTEDSISRLVADLNSATLENDVGKMKIASLFTVSIGMLFNYCSYRYFVCKLTILMLLKLLKL